MSKVSMQTSSNTKIKCACGWLGCKRRIKISKDNYLFVYDQEGKPEGIQLPRPIAKAILDACKVMDENDVGY